jgi:hypothetical protein
MVIWLALNQEEEFHNALSWPAKSSLPENLCALYAARRLWMEQSLGLSLLVAGMQNDLITSAKQ